MRDGLIVVAFMLLGLAAVGWLQLSVPPQDQSLVVFSPWEEEGFAKIIQAGGRPLRDGNIPGLYVVQHEDGPDFASAIHAAGAWFVTDPIIAGGCAYRRTRQQGLSTFEGATGPTQPLTAPEV